MIEVFFTVLFYRFWMILRNQYLLRSIFTEMPSYARIFRKMPVNASGMDFTLKCRHFPNPESKANDLVACNIALRQWVHYQ